MSLMPTPLPETQPYWDAAAEGKLAIQRCGDCAQCYFPPRASLHALHIAQRRVGGDVGPGNALQLCHHDQPLANVGNNGANIGGDDRA
ncbi:MAG: hypothetical protein K2Y20_03735 [Sphingomonas sp.]|nr:hypothetical protein [Sphingomonas sp.]